MSIPATNAGRSSWLVMLALLAAGGSHPPAAAPKKRSAPTGFHHDARFRKPVTISPRAMRLEEVLRPLGRATGVPWYEPLSGGVPTNAGAALAVADRHASSEILISCEAVPAGDVMDALAAAIHGDWARKENIWVLSDSPELVKFTCLSFNSFDKLTAPWVHALRALSPSQSNALMQRGVLYPKDLNLAQRKALLGNIQVAYVNGTVAPEALGLENVFLRWRSARDSQSGKHGAEMELVAPSPSGQTKRISSIEMPNLPPTPAVAASLSMQAPAPFEVSVPPAAPEREIGLRCKGKEDPNLQAQMRLSVGTASQAARTLMGEAKLNLVFSTRLNYWFVRGDTKKIAAWEVLEKIEQATAGRWYTVGSVYVLKPNPLVERAIQFQPSDRQNWTQLAAERIAKQLTSRQRESLRSKNQLAVTDLSSGQQDTLRWIAAMLFVTKSGLSPDACELKGVRLERRSREEDGRTGAELHFVFPAVTGASRTVSAALAN